MKPEAKPATLKDDIEAGLADVAAGRVQDFDIAQIIAHGRKRLADRSPAAALAARDGFSNNGTA